MRHKSKELESRRARWPWLSLLPVGLGAWAPIYAGVAARRVSWVLLGILWSAIVVAGFAQDSLGGHSGHDGVAGALLILGWVGAVATSFSIRNSVEHQAGSPLWRATSDAQRRLAERRQALALAAKHPPLALEMGIGRPDKEGAFDAGLVDVNNASASTLTQLPGVGEELAARIEEARSGTGGFISLEDLGATLDLPGDLVEALRGHVVFLPRAKP